MATLEAVGLFLLGIIASALSRLLAAEFGLESLDNRSHYAARSWASG
jgi:hypothetical protein